MKHQNTSYFRHFVVNIKVAIKCSVLSVFHFAHAVAPCKLTAHESWGINK